MRTKEEILLWKLKVSLQGGCEGVSLYEEGMTEEEKKPYKDLLLKEARTLLEEDRRFRNLYVEGPIRELCRFATACAGIKGFWRSKRRPTDSWTSSPMLSSVEFSTELRLNRNPDVNPSTSMAYGASTVALLLATTRQTHLHERTADEILSLRIGNPNLRTFFFTVKPLPSIVEEMKRVETAIFVNLFDKGEEPKDSSKKVRKII